MPLGKNIPYDVYNNPAAKRERRNRNECYKDNRACSLGRSSRPQFAYIIMTAEDGTSYNSYLVKGSEKTALIDSVKVKFWDEHLNRLKELVDPAAIDYLIISHAEPDHTGSIEKFLDINPNVTIFGSDAAIDILKEIANRSFKYQVVNHGDKLSLGNLTLTFLSVPFLHWPDSIYTYLEEEGILFSCDSFASHYPDEKLFNDLVDGDFLHAYQYYFDKIIGPFKQCCAKIYLTILNFTGSGQRCRNTTKMICPV